ncbi:MAG TPA: DUF4397 domain-containing protein [Ktedonobacteraceae bacterium]|jgi:hypothetical protein|nr:DUF4397 domain-containing protein [Ktedonobacteraceae bacterium]
MKVKSLVSLLSYRVMLALGMLSFLACSIFAWSLPAAAATQASSAMVRVVHASPDAGSVDVFVDGTKLLSNFAFGTITNYVSVPAGSHEIKVAPAGQGIGAAVISQSVSVTGGMAYTVAAIGTKSEGFGLTAFVDDNMLSGNAAKVRVYHLSPDAGPVNVAVGGNTVINGLTYKNASGYLTVPGGSYTFDVTATDSGAKVPVSASLSNGMVYSVFAVGLLKGNPAISFKLAAVAGIPGMPNTGSDPNAPAPAANPMPLYLGLLAVVLLGSGLVVRRFAYARNK